MSVSFDATIAEVFLIHPVNHISFVVQFVKTKDIKMGTHVFVINEDG